MPDDVRQSAPHPTVIARQHLETLRCLGVEVVPRAPRGRRTVPSSAPSAPAPPPSRDDPGATDTGRDRVPAPATGRGGGDAPAARLAELERRYRVEVADRFDGYPFTQPVFGEGNPTAELMFVGEGPGADEDRTGRPFVGRAGEKLEQMIRAMGFAREEVYIANVVKIRPPGNRTPEPGDVARCGPWLLEQIRIVRPATIVALGGPAASFLLETSTGITRLRGTWGVWRDPAGAGAGAEAGSLEIPVMPTYHPAYLLRTPTPEVRGAVWNDLQAVLARLGRR